MTRKEVLTRAAAFYDAPRGPRRRQASGEVLHDGHDGCQKGGQLWGIKGRR